MLDAGINLLINTERSIPVQVGIQLFEHRNLEKTGNGVL